MFYEMSYPEPPEWVWRALIDPQELAAWLMPNDFLPVVGHRFTMAWRRTPELCLVVSGLVPTFRDEIEVVVRAIGQAHPALEGGAGMEYLPPARPRPGKER